MRKDSIAGKFFMNSIYDWDLYHEINKTASNQKFYFNMEQYIPKNDRHDLNPS